MAKKKKRVTRKQLLKEPDEFITLSGKILQFAIAHKKQVSWGLSAVLAGVILVSAVQYFLYVADNKSLVLLEENMAKYGALSEEKGAQEAYLELQGAFGEMLDKYGRRAGGKLARVMYADICFNAQEYDKAIELYTRSLEDFDDNRFHRALILKSLGYAHEGKEDLATAASYFAMVDSIPDAIMKDEALFSLGRIYEAIGQQEKSTDAFKRLISDHSDSMYVEIAREKTRS